MSNNHFPPAELDEINLRSLLDRAGIGVFRTDAAASCVTACNRAFLRMVRAATRETVHLSDLVTHLLWLVAALTPELGENAGAVERELRIFEGPDGEQLFVRLLVTAVRHEGGDTGSITCMVRVATPGEGQIGWPPGSLPQGHKTVT